MSGRPLTAAALLLMLSTLSTWAAADLPANTERATPDRPPSDTANLALVTTTHRVEQPAPAAITLQLADSAHQANFDSGSDELTPSARERLDAFVAALQGQTPRQVLVTAHTDNMRLIRGALRRFGTNQGLSEARAASVAKYLGAALSLPESAFKIQGFGDSQPLAGNDDAAGRARNRRAEVTVWVEHRATQVVSVPVSETHVDAASRCIGEAAQQLPPVRITVDGVPLDSRESVNEDDRQRCVDVALARAEIQVRYDRLEQKPFLNALALPQLGVVGKPVRFQTYTNYPRYIEHAEIRVFGPDQSVQQTPLAVLPVDAGHAVEWTPPAWQDSLLHVTAAVENAHSVTYVLRVYDKQGRFDETRPRRLDIVRAAPIDTPATQAAARDAERAAYGENTLILHNIATAGGAITVNGSHVPPGDQVWVQGIRVPLDDAQNFVARQIMPAGPQQISVRS